MNFSKPTMLIIKNLTAKYHNTQKTALDGISFNVAKGDHIALLGPSGCGKTTLLQIISGLLRKQQADISGTLDWRGNATMPKIRMVFQHATLIPWRTVEKNISFGLEAMGIKGMEMTQKVDEMIKLVKLEKYRDYLPQHLSTGMQQRVNFARALACEPDLLLLDEPFSALDSKTKNEIVFDFMAILREKNITSIFVTHSQSEAQHMSNIMITLGGSPGKIMQIIKNEQTIPLPK
jgi:NitT/TauT family transport system ATP-binding protein